jgi:hypothetical protein
MTSWLHSANFNLNQVTIHKFQIEFWTHNIWAGLLTHSEVSNSQYNATDHGLLHGLGKLVVHITAAAVLCPALSWIASGDYLSDKLVVWFSPWLLSCIFLMFSVSTRYLDQLGQSAKYDTKVYCRQTLIGGNYGLLDTDTFVPNPDYYRQVSVMDILPQTCSTILRCIGLSHNIFQCLAVASAHGYRSSFHRHQWFFTLTCLCALQKAKGTGLLKILITHQLGCAHQT